ncbi:MAG TPA: tRNA (adenosine(37)-N6)-threonylcarbamoyltransferase complex transferase subunit TsaD [Thermomicrobiales bacterium]|jgi:N6-L-threonylcarbamoyladenine synthase|nr:tRNA (adenosine(37)-N6)-threonylcarbamoyltransferase complex transferase subunit TsaD [Thermomicrobiales bacterium]
MRILGIETSCDETAAAIVEDGRWIRSNVVASQIALHRTYGGVVPELAARGHVTAIMPVVRTALDEAGLTLADVGAIAVTTGPGLAGALLVGANTAKGMAFATGLRLIGVNHLEGHIAANWLVPAVVPAGSESGITDPGPPPLPAICLLVSGGHSELILVEAPGRYRHLGRTRDDAAGEAFDKGARLLGLGYPGGPAIQAAASGGDPDRFDLPRAWLPGSNDFSFSGLKTALLRAVDPYRIQDDAPRPVDDSPFPAHRPVRLRDDLPVADLAAGFQAAVTDVLATKTVEAAATTGARSLVLAGGVAANAALRERLVQAVERRWPRGGGPEIRYPALWLCTDNAAMIAEAGSWRLGEATAGWSGEIRPRWPLAELAELAPMPGTSGTGRGLMTGEGSAR